MFPNPNIKILVLVFGWLVLSSPVFADVDVLSAPQTSTHSTLAQPQGSSSDNSVGNSEPADVVAQNGKTLPSASFLTVPTPSHPTATVNPTPTIVKTPAQTPTPEKRPTKIPTPRGTLTSPIHQAKITTIPNPAYGDKVIFRVMTQGSASTQIVVYDRFFNKVATLSGDGERLFDILWSLKQVPEGLYYYQAKVIDSGTGESQMIPMQSFAVMKDTVPTDSQ